jgi:hypothetical protein
MTQSQGESNPGSGPDGDANTMAMLCHLLGICSGFVGPLIIWILKKDIMPFVDDQGKESLNWQFTLMIGWVAAGILSCFIIGHFIWPLILICNIIFCIKGALDARDGNAYRYPFSIKFMK